MRHLKLFFVFALISLFSISMWADTPAAAGTTLFSEDFSSYSANDVPSGSVTTATGRVVYGGANVTYACTNGDGTSPGTTKIYAEALATGTSPEILVGKYGSGGSTGGSLSITGIPSGGAQEITVSFKQNKQKLKVAVAGTGYTSAGVDAKPAAAGSVSFDITVADGAAATFDLTFSVYSSNVRVDDILVTVKTAGEGAGTPKTLTGVAVSGTPTKTIYNTGDNFDPAGLTVTGTYSDASTAPISSGITWAYTPSQTLALNQTSIGVTATVSEITSAEYNVTGLTVAAAPTVVSAIEDIEDGASYYIRGVRSSGAVVEYLKFTDGTAGATISGTSASSTAEAIAITFNKVSDGVYQLVTPEGLYVQPGASNGKIALSTTETTCNLANTTKTWDSSDAIAISTVDGSSNTWIIQKNTSGTNFGGYKNSQYDVTLVLASAAATVAKPTISGEDNFVTSTEVSMTCSTAGAAIYYTTTESAKATPATSGDWAAYNDADKPSFSATTTVWAAAKKDDDWSSVAEKTFTKAAPLTTTQAVYDKAVAVGSTATAVGITFNNWVVSGISLDNKSVYITDGTKGFVIYDNTGASHGFAVNDKLSGTVSCQVKLYSKFAEVLGVTSSSPGLTVTHDGVVTPVVATIADLGAVNTGAPIILNSVQFDGTVLSDGANSITPYTTFYADAVTSLESGKYYNITGLYVHHNTTKEVAPRSAADIEELTLADPELSYSPASETIEVGDSWSAPTFNNEHGLTVSFSGDNDAVATVNTTTGEIALAGGTGTAVITASFAGNATYAAGNATYTITVNPASVSENVVILAVYDTKYYAMSTNNASNAFTAIEVEYDGSQVTVNSAEDKAAIQWTKKISGDNTTFQDADDKYMKGTSSGAAMSLDANVCNWSWDGTNEYYYIGTRTFLYYKDNIFKNYATSNIGKSSSGYSNKAEVIVIDPANIVISSKVSAELAYDPASDEITQGDAWSAPSLVNPHSVAITSYNSDNESVATVTDGGVIALASGTGTAHITAHFEGDASYLAGDAVYTITVNAPAPIPSGTTYTKVTSTGDITDGEYLIVYETTSVAFNGALETLDAEGNSVAVVISGDEIAGTTAIDAAVFTIDVTAGTLQSASGHYIGVSSNSNGLKQTDDAATYTHTFSIDGDGNAVILANFESSTMKLRYNPSTSAGNLRFRYYKNDGQQAIQLYKKEAPAADYTRDDMVSPGVLGTICLEYNVPLAQASGAVFYELAGRSADGKIAFDEITTGELEAGKPYVFQATADQIQIFYGSTHVTEPDNSGALKGTFSATTIENTDPNWANIYYFANKALWGTSDLTSLSVPANRAYLVLSEVDPVSSANPAPGRRRITMNVNGEQIATGFENIESGDVPMKVMIEGTLYILRGEKVFDATGRLVK